MDEVAQPPSLVVPEQSLYSPRANHAGLPVLVNGVRSLQASQVEHRLNDVVAGLVKPDQVLTDHYRPLLEQLLQMFESGGRDVPVSLMSIFPLVAATASHDVPGAVCMLRNWISVLPTDSDVDGIDVAAPAAAPAETTASRVFGNIVRRL